MTPKVVVVVSMYTHLMQQKLEYFVNFTSIPQWFLGGLVSLFMSFRELSLSFVVGQFLLYHFKIIPRSSTSNAYVRTITSTFHFTFRTFAFPANEFRFTNSEDRITPRRQQTVTVSNIPNLNLFVVSFGIFFRLSLSLSLSRFFVYGNLPMQNQCFAFPVCGCVCVYLCRPNQMYQSIYQK